jgi:hypothetical protein
MKEIQDKLDQIPDFARMNEMSFSPAIDGRDSNDFDFDKNEQNELADRANLIGSRVYIGGEEYHIPMIDLDIDSARTESSTPGHSHLWLDKPLTKQQYQKLLNVLHELGIIQTGILNQFDRDGQTCLRVPWVKKGDTDKGQDEGIWDIRYDEEGKPRVQWDEAKLEELYRKEYGKEVES